MIARRRPNRAPINAVVRVIAGWDTLLLIVSKQPKYASAGIQRIIRRYMGEAAFLGKNATNRPRVKLPIGQCLRKTTHGRFMRFAVRYAATNPPDS
jgi:hypothetical protein